jgi:predicted transcriptional regulator
LDGTQGKTATEIRKSLLARHPTALNATLRALADLRNLRLIRRIDGTRARSKRYVLTPMGRRIVEEMQR